MQKEALFCFPSLGLGALDCCQRRYPVIGQKWDVGVVHSVSHERLVQMKIVTRAAVGGAYKDFPAPSVRFETSCARCCSRHLGKNYFLRSFRVWNSL